MAANKAAAAAIANRSQRLQHDAMVDPQRDNRSDKQSNSPISGGLEAAAKGDVEVFSEEAKTPRTTLNKASIAEFELEIELLAARKKNTPHPDIAQLLDAMIYAGQAYIQQEKHDRKGSNGYDLADGSTSTLRETRKRRNTVRASEVGDAEKKRTKAENKAGLLREPGSRSEKMNMMTEEAKEEDTNDGTIFSWQGKSPTQIIEAFEAGRIDPSKASAAKVVLKAIEIKPGKTLETLFGLGFYIQLLKEKQAAKKLPDAVEALMSDLESDDDSEEMEASSMEPNQLSGSPRQTTMPPPTISKTTPAAGRKSGKEGMNIDRQPLSTGAASEDTEMTEIEPAAASSSGQGIADDIKSDLANTTGSSAASISNDQSASARNARSERAVASLSDAELEVQYGKVLEFWGSFVPDD
ncbi:hypothetical protein VTL71DRAFT_12976 [Oculimacula yallundae]|uniref:Uncharacterized protein n=1 Tax=Oculimacula yallundae TaxID=86028 RepID=A0ABR4CP05_9HELO